MLLFNERQGMGPGGFGSFVSDRSPTASLVSFCQFLSMLESLFEKEAKRMEIDMKAAL